MKRSPGPTPSSPLMTNSASVGVGELALDPALHPLGEHVAGPLHAGQVDEDQLASASRSVATPRIARRVVCGRTETIATWQPTIALTRVDLPTLGRPARPMKPDAGHAEPLPASTSRLQREHLAVVGLVVVAAEVEDAVDGGLGHVGAVLGADRDVAELARAGASGPCRRSGRRARRSARPCRGASRLSSRIRPRRRSRPRGGRRRPRPRAAPPPRLAAGRPGRRRGRCQPLGVGPCSRGRALAPCAS